MESIKRKVSTIDAFISYCVALVILLSVGGIFQYVFGFYGLGMIQVSIIITPLLIIIFKRASFQETLQLKIPTIKHILGSIILWMALFCIVNAVTYVLMPLSDYNMEVAEELAHLTYHPSLLMNLFVVAFLPAVCEEILFRGVIFKGIANKHNKEMALIISSVLFGMLHFDWIRIVPTTILGLGMGYAVYKTGSLLTSIIIHFINNGLIVWMGHLTPIADVDVQGELATETMWQSAISLFGIGVLILFIALYFFENRKNDRID